MRDFGRVAAEAYPIKSGLQVHHRTAPSRAAGVDYSAPGSCWWGHSRGLQRQQPAHRDHQRSATSRWRKRYCIIFATAMMQNATLSFCISRTWIADARVVQNATFPFGPLSGVRGFKSGNGGQPLPPKSVTGMVTHQWHGPQFQSGIVSHAQSDQRFGAGFRSQTIGG